MRRGVLVLAAAGVAVLCSAIDIAGEPKHSRAKLQFARGLPAKLAPLTLHAVGTTLIEQRQMSWHERRLPARQARKMRDRVAVLEIMKELHEKELMSLREIKNNELAVAELRSLVARDRQVAAVDPPAVVPVEKNRGRESARSKRRASRPRPVLIRYDGGANWSIDDADKIEAFFRKRFGRSLPVSAFGQSPTHDRLGLDHSDALDVAVRPDSAEGRALMAHLRAAGIPFTAFRGTISRVSTGPHIHIGPPSPRIAVAERSPQGRPAVEEAAEQS